MKAMGATVSVEARTEAKTKRLWAGSWNGVTPGGLTTKNSEPKKISKKIPTSGQRNGKPNYRIFPLTVMKQGFLMNLFEP